MDKHIPIVNYARRGAPDIERSIPVAVEPGPILVATDGGSGADAAFVAAAFLAGRTGAEVRVVSVIEPDAAGGEGATDREVAREVTRRDLVEAQLRRTVGDDAGWSVSIATGSIGQAIRFAAGADTRLIILGRRWHHAVSGAEGSAAVLRVLATTNAPVYVVSPDAHGIPTRAVVAMDFGAASIWAARVASDLVATGGTVYLVHVTSLTARRAAAGGVAVGGGGFADDTRAALDRLGQSLRRSGAVRVPSIILYGQAPAELLAFAEGVFADLVACGASAKTLESGDAPSRPRIGDVAADILRHAACPILVAPVPSSPVEPVPQ